MSLTDVDKSSDGRLSPKPNASDDVLKRMAHKTISTTYRSTDLKQRVAFDQSQIQTYDENNVLSSFYGYDPDIAENPVLKIAKPGYDAKTGADADMIFNSQQNVFKVAKTVYLTLPALSLNTGGANYAVGTPQFASVPHGLSTTPALLAYFDSGGAFVAVPWTFAGQYGSGGFSYVELFATSDATNIYVNGKISGFNINTTQPAYTFKIYVLQETAN